MEPPFFFVQEDPDMPRTDPPRPNTRTPRDPAFLGTAAPMIDCPLTDHYSFPFLVIVSLHPCFNKESLS